MRSRPLAVVLSVHLLVRVAVWLGGVGLTTLPLTGYWQTADLALLRTEPVTTVWHLHAQPPLWNLVVAVVEQLPTSLHHPVFRLLLMLAGLTVVLAVWTVARRLGVRPRVAAAAALVVSLSPSLLGYELFVFYTLPVAALLAAVVVAADRFEVAADPRWLAAAAALAATVALTRSLFHLAWVVVMVVVLVVWHGRRPSPRTLAAAALPVLVVVAWYARVAALTGTFGASTWLGMSLAKVTVAHLDAAELEALVAAGEIDAIALRPAFQAPYHYADLVVLPEPTGVAILDEVATSSGVRNLHNLGVPAVSDAYARAARQVVAARPGVLVTQLQQGTCFYLRPGHASDQVAAVHDELDWWRTAWDRVVLLQLREDTSKRCDLGALSAQGLASTSPTAAVLVLAPIVLGVAALLRRVRRRERPGDLALAVMGLTVGYVTVATTLLEVGENYRFRFLVEPLGWIALAVVVERVLRRRST